MSDALFAPDADHGVSLAVVVVRGGEVIHERYGHQPPSIFGPGGPVTADTALISWSMAKSITQAAVGATTVDALRAMRVDVAFIGANGVTLDHGFSTPDPAEGDVKRAMIGSGRRVVVLADSSKFGAEYLISFAKPADVDVLVTDRGLSSSARQLLIDSGIEVVLA